MSDKTGLLVFDTTSSQARIGLYIDDERYSCTYDEHFRHIENLIPLVEQGLESMNQTKDRIGRIAVCNGPGSFTGIRIGIASALGMAFAINTTAMGFTVFDIYRYIHRSEKDVIIVPLIDARKKRYYCSFLKPGSNEYTMYDYTPAEIVDHVLSMEYSNRHFYFCGKDSADLRTLLESELPGCTITSDSYTTDQMLDFVLSSLADGDPLGIPEAIYLRKSEAEIMLEKRIAGS
jgi:tRNA threonylcarbamoyladenosine biosynthesis protein TsaB